MYWATSAYLLCLWCSFSACCLCVSSNSVCSDSVIYINDAWKFFFNFPIGVEDAFSFTSKVMTVSLHKFSPGFFPGKLNLWGLCSFGSHVTGEASIKARHKSISCCLFSWPRRRKEGELHVLHFPLPGCSWALGTVPLMLHGRIGWRIELGHSTPPFLVVASGLLHTHAKYPGSHLAFETPHMSLDAALLSLLIGLFLLCRHWWCDRCWPGKRSLLQRECAHSRWHSGWKILPDLWIVSPLALIQLAWMGF